MAANPGGLGRVDEADVAGEPPADLLAAMRLAADRDRVARQYAEGFCDVLETVVPWLQEELADGYRLPEAIVRLHLRLMSAFPDDLIARRLGHAAAGSRRRRWPLKCWRPEVSATRSSKSESPISTSGCEPTIIAAIPARPPI